MQLLPRRNPSYLSRLMCLLLAVAVCAPTAYGGGPASGPTGSAVGADGPQSNSHAGDRAALVARLDSIAREALEREPLAGVSVAVLRGQDTLLLRGYGYADIGLKAPVSEETTFRIAEPVLLGAALMQQVERGRLRLDDDASQLLPEFPWHGRRVTVRQLMDMTSGLPSYHFLGDPIRSQRAVPKATDEVTALFAGRPFNHEPGERYELTISGFHLAGILLERVSGQPYPDYLREHIFKRAGLTRSFYCDDRTASPGLARSYDLVRGGFLNYPLETATLYPYTAGVCMSSGDAASLMRALRDGRLLRPESYRAMTTAVGAAWQKRQEPRGVGLTIGQVGQDKGHRWVGGHHYPLMGFSCSLMDFPDHGLTIAVLSNGGRSYATSPIARNLARAVLGLPPNPPRQLRPEEPLPAGATPLGAAERARYVGMYRTKWSGGADFPHRHWQRTYRVFEENGRLMLQALGEAPEPLLRTGEHTFTVASWAVRVLFTLREGRAVGISLYESDDLGVSGPRVDEAWPYKPYQNR